MGRYLLLVLLNFLSSIALAQWGSQQIISNTDDGAFRVLPYDMDKDGNMDVITASFSDNTISWYENLDGSGTFSSESIITNGISSMEDVQLHDVNGDGSADIVLKNLANDFIVWLENLDDQGNFGSAQIIQQGTYCYFFMLDDLDGDGDLDVIANLHNYNQSANKLVWYENLDGLGNFGTEQAIFDEPFHYAQFPNTLDLDNDGDRDLLLVYYFFQSCKLVWFENDGFASFSEPQQIMSYAPISSDFRRIVFTSEVDIDDDGYSDILFNTGHIEAPDNINWIKNLGGSGNFSTPYLIHEEEDLTLRALISNDLDNDGDFDILIADSVDDQIHWIENTNGSGSFGELQTVTSSLGEVLDANLADLNGDGNLDILSADSLWDTVAWYEFGGLGTTDYNTAIMKLIPNPTRNHVVLSQPLSITSVHAYTLQGTVMNLTWEGQQIDTSILPSSIYLLVLETKEGVTHTFKLIRE